MIGAISAYSIVADTGMPRAALAEPGRNPPAVVKAAAVVPRRSGMSPGTAFHFFHRHAPSESSGTALALLIAILFAVVAAISFAVDQSITLSNLPAPPPAHSAGR
jgi:hypothetical protein